MADNLSGSILVLTVNGTFFDYGVANFFCKLPEVGQGDYPDVGRIIPGKGKLTIFRSFAFQQELEADSVMAEIREADDYLSADSGQRFQENVWLINLLQGLTEDNHVKACIRIIKDLVFQVSLQDTEAATDTGRGFLLVLFNAGPLDLFMLFEPGQEIAMTTAEIKHPCSWFDP